MKKTNSGATKRKKASQGRAFSAAFPRFTLECAERHELLLCGCKKIECYSPEETVLCSAGGKIRVCGANMRISFTGDGKIMLSGIINAIEFI